MLRRPQRSTRTDTIFPDTTPFRSKVGERLRDLAPVAGQHHRLVRPGEAEAQLRMRGALQEHRLVDQLGDVLLAHHRRRHAGKGRELVDHAADRSEENTSELQSLMRISYAVFCWTNKNHIFAR